MDHTQAQTNATSWIDQSYDRDFGASDYSDLPSELRREVEDYVSRPQHTKTGTETKETLCRLQEESASANKQFRWEKQDELRAVRLGRIIHCIEFLRLLNRIVPARYSGVAKHGLLKLEVLFPTLNGGEWRFVCGAQPGSVPEYSTMYFDQHGLPTSEMYRGWRTTLLRLIAAGAITEEAAHKVFGDATGSEAGRYRKQLQDFRNRKFI